MQEYALHASKYQNKQAGEMRNIHQVLYKDCRSISKILSIGAGTLTNAKTIV